MEIAGFGAPAAPAGRVPQGASRPTDRRVNANGEPVGEDGLTDAERREVEKLRERDREVRRHEQAHIAAGGGYVSQATYRFVIGPDGRQYAVGGEVKIDTSPIPGNPEATIRKMEIVKRAALAPEQPSAQDRRVAAQAEAAILRARQEINRREQDETREARGREVMPAEAQPQPREIPAIFDPERRFRALIGGTGSLPADAGLVGAGALNLTLGVLEPGELFNLVA